MSKTKWLFLGLQQSMVFILHAKKDFEGAHLGPCEAHWGPIKMAHDWAKSRNSVGTPKS